MENRRKAMFWSGLGFLGLEMLVLVIAGLSALDWSFVNVKFFLFTLLGLLNIGAFIMMFAGLKKDEERY